MSSESPEEGDYHYVLQSPFATAIRPLVASSDATLSLFHEINASFPRSKRLPAELLHNINKELHCPNADFEDIQSTWSPATECSSYGACGLYPYYATLDPKTRIYRLNHSTEKRDFDKFYPFGQVSSADLLYRLRCFFLEIDICSEGIDGCKAIWSAVLRHNPSSMEILFTESKAVASLLFSQKTNHNIDCKSSRDALVESLATDAVRLLNAFFAAVNGDRSSAYYHPAAFVDSCGVDERFIAVPDVTSKIVWKKKSTDSCIGNGTL